jgi:hypothetical protein
MSTKKYARFVQRELDAAGLTTERVEQGKHLKFFVNTPSGRALLVTSVSPSDQRSALACRAQIRRLARRQK